MIYGLRLSLILALCASIPFAADAPLKTPAPLTSLRNAADFIQAQRGLDGHGLPATFYVPHGLALPNPENRLLLTEGVGLYDTALAMMALLEVGRLADVRAMLDIYTSGYYGTDDQDPMELRAYPAYSNGKSFQPFDADTAYFFDFTNVYGHWSRWKERWKFWTVHTGPNAWLLNATARFIIAARGHRYPEASLRRYVTLADSLERAILRLQDVRSAGGVRYGPHGVYHADGTADPFDEINVENNISAYAAFMALYQVTNNLVYRQGAHRILMFLKEAPVWTQEGKMQRGLQDPRTGTFAMGIVYKEGRWILETEHPTDSGGTWAIDALGPEKIDSLWGPLTAYRMWRTIRRQAGRTADFHYAEDARALAGLDYNDAYPPNESLISPEWTAGGLFALRQLIDYYRGRPHALAAAELAALQRDQTSMAHFIRGHSNAYAFGPGHAGIRCGQTGFGWASPPPKVMAMASIYFALYAGGGADPISWWREPFSGRKNR